MLGDGEKYMYNAILPVLLNNNLATSHGTSKFLLYLTRFRSGGNVQFKIVDQNQRGKKNISAGS